MMVDFFSESWPAIKCTNALLIYILEQKFLLVSVLIYNFYEVANSKDIYTLATENTCHDLEELHYGF